MLNESDQVRLHQSHVVPCPWFSPLGEPAQLSKAFDFDVVAALRSLGAVWKRCIVGIERWRVCVRCVRSLHEGGNSTYSNAARRLSHSMAIYIVVPHPSNIMSNSPTKTHLQLDIRPTCRILTAPFAGYRKRLYPQHCTSKIDTCLTGRYYNNK